MGIKKSINKIFSYYSRVDFTTGNENASQKEIDDIYLKNIADNGTQQREILSRIGRKKDNFADADRTKHIRQEGSLWVHRHDGLDWHTMSIPHPAPDKKIGGDITGTPASTKFAGNVADTRSDHQVKSGRESTISKKDILAKFVIQDGKRIGETISIDSNYLVFKSGADNLNIPISSIINITEDHVTVGDFNRDESLDLGKNWLHRTTNRLKFDEKGMLIND